ncbi:hypothetical protein ACLOJK_029086 [Asimina triloba]
MEKPMLEEQSNVTLKDLKESQQRYTIQKDFEWIPMAFNWSRLVVDLACEEELGEEAILNVDKTQQQQYSRESVGLCEEVETQVL